MTSLLVDTARSDIPEACHAVRCSGPGCVLPLTDLREERVLINMDCGELGLSEQAARCDYLFVGEQNVIAPIELKKGEVVASKVCAQLRAGAAFAEAQFSAFTKTARFRPVAGYGRIHKAQRQLLRRRVNHVDFGGQSYEIKLAKCGQSLLSALK